MYFYLVHLLFLGGGVSTSVSCKICMFQNWSLLTSSSKKNIPWPKYDTHNFVILLYSCWSCIYIRAMHTNTHIPKLICCDITILCPKYMYQSTCVQLNEANKLIKIIQCCVVLSQSMPSTETIIMIS